MATNEIFFKSNDNKTNIHMVTWVPEGEVLGIVQINHGVSEHIGRYAEFAEFLNSHGILAVGIDLLGHGMSTNNGDKKMYFGPDGSYKVVLADIDHVVNAVKANYPNVPYTMLGLSLGSFLTRAYYIDNPNKVDGAILIGTSHLGKISYKLARFVVDKEAKKYGDEALTEKIRDLAFGTYNKYFKPNRTAYDWFCKSDRAVDEYIDDPLRGGNLSVGVFREMLNSMMYCSQVDNIGKTNKDFPVVLLSGSEDYVGDKGKGVQKALSVLKKQGLTKASMKLYPSLRHAILHEDERVVVFEDILKWLKENNLVLEKSEPTPVVEEKEVEKKSEPSDGLVDYDEYDVVWPKVGA